MGCDFLYWHTSVICICIKSICSCHTDEFSFWCFAVILFTAQEAALFLQKSGVLQKADVSMEIVYSDIQDQYRLFFGLEKLLQSPPKLIDQQIYQMDTDMQRQVIERLLWYSYMLLCFPDLVLFFS